MNKHEGSNYFLHIIVNGTVIVWLYHLLAYTFLFFMPPSFFFDYLSLAPAKKEFTHTENIVMVSNIIFKRDLTLEYSNVLHCPPIDFYNQAITYWYEEKWQKVNQQSVYQNNMPQADSECYIESTITATTDYGLKKKETVRSGSFLIK